ncbi:MAG: type I DNA topoisomerase [bacterium]|nr:type I DNA topoisomerase [bacterium]
MSKTLVIVESPTKAKKIGEFLGSDFVVKSSYGHIRDLPKGKLGVDVANDFATQYVIPEEDRKHVADLEAAAANAHEVILATDEDREGEAIAWHLAEALKLPPEKTKRIVFHEITKSAIAAALAHPRTIDQRLVDAQQARRILDRLVGYTLSPFLWRKVAGGLSAGRVQSVAVRILVDREREVRAFKPEEYWSIAAHLTNVADAPFTAELRTRDGKKFVPNNADEATATVTTCEHATWTVTNVEEKELRRTPTAPFTTSTLQQEASRKLGFSVKQTMTLAQRLYENGYITYMRTDSVAIAAEALDAIRKQVREQFGAPYTLPQPRTYATKSKGAQEAHEAIRPTDPSRTPTALANELEEGQRRLYELVWLRTMATQMPDAQLKRVGVDVQAASQQPQASSSTYTFRATGQTIVFDGFLRVYQEGRDEDERHNGEDAQDGEKLLPPLAAGERCALQELKPEQHFTKPPPRFTEAALVKKLEEEGIGRPSTYAPTISTVIARGYVRKEGRQLIPEEVAFLVIDLLKEHFTDIVDLKFTAKMEEDLDRIAVGEEDDAEFLHRFWDPFDAQVKQKAEELTRANVLQERVVGKDPASGFDVLVRSGRYGPYVQLGRPEEMPVIAPPVTADGAPKKSRARKPKTQKPKVVSLPKGTDTETVTLEQALALLAFPRALGAHEGNEVTANLGRFGPYVKCGDINASIPDGTDPATLTLEQALTLCTERKEQKRQAAAPLRTLGMSTDTNTEIVIKTGRFGPYVTDGTTMASVPKKSSVEAITLEEAIDLLAKKRARGPGRRGGFRKK